MIPADPTPGTARLLAQVIHAAGGPAKGSSPLAPRHAEAGALIETTCLTLDMTVATLKENKGCPHRHQGKTP